MQPAGVSKSLTRSAFPIGSKSRCVLYQCTPSCAKTRLSGPLADEFSLRGERDRPIRPQDVGNAVRSSPII